ncbi:MAG: hypothetical protein EXR93_04350 [Gemmatimonadetes bacterium]|nr:hypothetical protein [Gemmatimonadota bacterium]
MKCTDFLRQYSDYRDGLIHDPLVVGQLGLHLATCAACGRYDASVRNGVQALRRASVDVEPTPRFRDRLRQRIAAGGETETPATSAAASMAALLVLAAALALVIHQRSTTAELAPGTRTANRAPHTTSPSPMVIVNAGVPFVTFTDLQVPAFSSAAMGRLPYHAPLDTGTNLPR